MVVSPTTLHHLPSALARVVCRVQALLVGGSGSGGWSQKIGRSGGLRAIVGRCGPAVSVAQTIACTVRGVGPARPAETNYEDDRRDEQG